MWMKTAQRPRDGAGTGAPRRRSRRFGSDGPMGERTPGDPTRSWCAARGVTDPARSLDELVEKALAALDAAPPRPSVGLLPRPPLPTKGGSCGRFSACPESLSGQFAPLGVP